MNVNGQTLTYCKTLSAQVSSHCPSLAANCDEARHLISLCLSIELLGRLVNKARHKSHERRINVTSTSFVVLVPAYSSIPSPVLDPPNVIGVCQTPSALVSAPAIGQSIVGIVLASSPPGQPGCESIQWIPMA